MRPLFVIKHLPNFDKKILALFLICLSISSLTVFELVQVLATPAPSRNSTVEPGSMTTFCDYLFYTDGSTYLARNGNTGVNDYLGTSIVTVAQNALNAQGAGRYCFDSGSFDFLGGQSPPASFPVTIVSVGLILPDSAIVQGAGLATILKTSTAVSGVNDNFVMFVNKDVTTNDGNIIVQNLQIQLPNPTQTATGLLAWDDGAVFGGAHDTILQNIRVVNGGVSFEPNQPNINHATALTAGQNYNNLVTGCTFLNETGSSSFFQATRSKFISNTIVGAWDDAFLVGSAGKGHIISQNYIDAKAVVANKGASSASISFDNDGAVGAAADFMSNMTVTENIILNNYKNSAGGGRTGISLTADSNILIRGNIIGNNTGSGIKAENSNHIMILDNHIYKNGGQGIAWVASVTGTYYDLQASNNQIFNNAGGIQLQPQAAGKNLQDAVISGNLFYDDQGAPTQTYAYIINIGGTVANILFTGNNAVRNPNQISITGGSTGGLTFRSNAGYNPTGFMTNFIYTTFIGNCGSSATPIASTAYAVCWNDVFITSTGGTGVSISVTDPTGNILESGLATITVPLWLPIGYKINFGPFSVAPTVKVFGN